MTSAWIISANCQETFVALSMAKPPICRPAKKNPARRMATGRLAASSETIRPVQAKPVWAIMSASM